MAQYPHEMSGGMRQRIVGAIGISCEPRLLIADEPTTSLDLTIQAQYLNLLRDLQREHGLALIFITHNLGIVAKMCDQLAVMYAGRMVEQGPVSRIFYAPAHPYTKALLELDPAHDATTASGSPPSTASRPISPSCRPGCAFAPRCPAAFDRCRAEAPPEFALGAGRTARCWLAVPQPSRPPREPSGATIGMTAVLGGARPHQALPGPARLLRRPIAAWCARSTASRSPSSSGKTLGVVGESGCGKTTTAKLVLGLEEPTSGAILLRGARSAELDKAGRRHYRNSVQAVFQDPFASLNPRMRISAIIAEPLITNETVDRAEVRRRMLELLDLVGLPERSADLFPHEFSGGQRQRIAIARALVAVAPLVVLDEPVSALDVSIRAQILNLLRDLQARLGLSYLFIAHDLAAVAHMSHEIVVMYLGKIVESGDARDASPATPLHPYTKALFSAALPSHPDERHEELILSGEVPSPLNPPSGCHFHPRCPHAMPPLRPGAADARPGSKAAWSPATCSARRGGHR